jgi:hypothetical protein
MAGGILVPVERNSEKLENTDTSRAQQLLIFVQEKFIVRISLNVVFHLLSIYVLIQRINCYCLV